MITLRPVAPLSTATRANRVVPTCLAPTTASLTRIRLMAARAAAAYGPMIAVVDPAVKKLTMIAMAMAMTVTQNATLTESLEYWVSTAKLLACCE